MNENKHIVIKGIKNGILVELNPAEEWLRVTEELANQLDAKLDFYRGAKVTVDLGERPVPKHELTSLKALLDRRGLQIWSVMSGSETTIQAAHTLDLKTNVANTVPQSREAPATADDASAGTPSTVVKRTLRSGQRIKSEGVIVVVGDVNPGAEIIAKGDVVVWGRLRGTVHAGSEGDEEAVICALDMSPTQLRIAGHIVTSPPGASRRQPYPEIARVKEQQIIVETWR